MLNIRNVTIADLPDLLAIQASCYPENYWESDASFLTKIKHYPQLSFLCENETGIVAYFICLLADKQTFPRLNSELNVSEKPIFFYCHDMVVLPTARGQGIARKLMATAELKARQLSFDSLCLVAVNAIEYWQKLGFIAHDPAKLGISNQVASFGEQALFMVKRI